MHNCGRLKKRLGTTVLEHLVNVSSGFHAKEKIKNDQIISLASGKKNLDFVEERLDEWKKPVFEPIKQAKLKTSSTCTKKVND